jgi:hemolysin III
MASSLELEAPATVQPADRKPMASARTNEVTPTAGEERANYLTHGAGVLVALVGVSALLQHAASHGAGVVIACAVYGVTLVLMLASSTAYHAMPATNQAAKRALRTLDHSAIFLLIAGTYTALSLAVPHSAPALALLGGVWVLSAFGILALARRGGRKQGGPLVFYLGLSALVALSLPALREPLGLQGFWLLSAGGIVYALGIPFYLARRLPYHHMIWHGFVLAASALHFVVVLRYVANMG